MSETLPRVGRHFPPAYSRSFIQDFPELMAHHEFLVSLGFELMPLVLRYRKSADRISVRLVWRNRRRDQSSVLNATYCLNKKNDP